MALYWDKIKYSAADSFDTEEKKDQILIFTIKDNKHLILLSFSYQDVKNSSNVMELCEIYNDKSKIRREGDNIFIDIHYLDQVHRLVMEDAFNVKYVEESKFLTKCMYNCYEYLERTILDRVNENELKLDQCVSQIKKIMKYLNST